MRTLTSLYREREPALRQRLAAAPTLADAVAVLLTELQWLEGVTTGDLTIPQQRVFLSMLEVQRASLRSMKDAPRLESVPQTHGPVYHFVRWLRGLLGGGDPPAPSVPSRYRVGLENEALLRHFASALETIDRQLAAVPDTPPSEEPRELLEFLQRVMGDASTGNTRLLQERLQQIPQLVESYGVQYVFYDPAKTPRGSAQARRLFRFETSLDPDLKQTTTFLPACVRGDDVLYRGLVVEPAGTGQGGRR